MDTHITPRVEAFEQALDRFSPLDQHRIVLLKSKEDWGLFREWETQQKVEGFRRFSETDCHIVSGMGLVDSLSSWVPGKYNGYIDCLTLEGEYMFIYYKRR